MVLKEHGTPRAAFSDLGGDRGVGAGKKVSHLFKTSFLLEHFRIGNNLYFLKDKCT